MTSSSQATLLHKGQPSPYDSASAYSRLRFNWLTPLLQRGAVKPLTDDDVEQVPQADQAAQVFARFAAEWEADCKSCSASGARGTPSLARVFARMYVKPFLFSAFCYAFYATSTLSLPFLIKAMVEFFVDEHDLRDVQGGDYSLDTPWRGYRIALGMLLVVAIGSLGQAHSYHLTLRILMRMRAALISVIFRKSLRLSGTARRDTRVGQIVNLMSSDSQRLIEFAPGPNLAWSSPLIVCIGIGLMYREVGASAFVALGTMFAFLPLSAYLTKKQVYYQRASLSRTDRRISIINEIVQSIRVVKFYAWERPFLDIADEARERELELLRNFLICKALNFGVLITVPFASALLTFTTYVSTGGVMDSATVFTTVSLIHAIRFPFTFLPLAVNFLVQMVVSFRRIEAFLQLEEIEEGVIGECDDEDVAVHIEDASIGWGGADEEEAAILSDVNLSIPEGELVLVIGPVGCGKSTLLSAILGEAHISKGSVKRSGKLAYVSQSAFIVNGTVRDNIVFGKPFIEGRYNAVLQACQLLSDLELLPAGDMCEIGERGVNLSGGQKQRVNLARALYASDADLILLDDPLSAVDAHVGQRLFDQCINGELMRDKTRILVTHGLTHLPHADRIVVMRQREDGAGYCVAETGTFKQLMANGLDFASLMDAYDVKARATETEQGGTSDRDTASQREDKVGPKPPPLSKKPAAGDDDGQLVEDEELERGAVNTAVYSSYLHGGGISFMYLILAIFVCTALSSMGSDVWLSRWSNEAGDDEDANDDVGFYLGVYAALIMCLVVFVVCRALFTAIFGLRASRSLYHNLMVNILRRKSRFFDTTPVGRILNRVSSDINMVDTNLSQTGEHTLAVSLTLLSIFILIVSIVPPTVVPLLIVVYFLLGVQRYFRRSARELQRLEAITRTPVFTHFAETLGGVSVIRALGLQEQFADEQKKRTDDNSSLFYHNRAAVYWLRHRLDLFTAAIIFTTGSMAVFLLQVDVSPPSAGLVGLLLTYSVTAVSMMSWTVILSTALESQFNAVERILFYSTADEDEMEDCMPPDEDKLKADWLTDGHVEFDDVELRYAPHLPAVCRLSLDIAGGSRVALVGRTGSGKSTSLKAIFRVLEPSHGRVLIDGVDISTLHLYDLRSRLAIIPQEPVLFANTLRYNLDPFCEFPDERLVEVLELVQMKDRMGLDDAVEEGGGNLSAGEQQLLCLARALLRRPKICCLDEATASVDVETDAIVQRVLREHFPSCTILTIAHRLETVMDYDKIVVLDQGRVIEYGVPAELVEDPNSELSKLRNSKNES